MRKLVLLLSFFGGTLAAQTSKVDSTSSSKLTELLLKDSTIYEPQNEIAIANFFPMIFQQTWAGNMGVIYKRHIFKKGLAVRIQFNGNINQNHKQAFDNNELATKVNDEFNNYTTGSVNYNIGIGIQKNFINEGKLKMYQLVDLFKGGYSYNQISVNMLNYVNGPNGKTITSFARYETGQSNVSYGINYGLGMNYTFYKNFSLQIETTVGANFNRISVTNQRKTIDLNIAENNYFVSQLDETKTPDYTTTVFNLSPVTNLYFSYKF